MQSYKLVIDKSALSDIQDAVKWYNKRLPNLGNSFKKVVIRQIDGLTKNANGYNIRYHNVRCMPVKKFPYLIHFTIDEVNTTIEIFAVFHTSRNPDIWQERIKEN